MTTGSYSIGFNLVDGYAKRATIHVQEATVVHPDTYQDVTLSTDAGSVGSRDVNSSSEDLFDAAFSGVIGGENTTTTGLKSGSHIRTTRGVAAVDFLAAGDEVVTANGTTRRIERVERRFAAADGLSSVTIRIARGALADQKPSQDLWLAPQQMLVVGGVAVSAISLVNGISIEPVNTVEPAACFHVVLDRPAFMLAEDMPVASYSPKGIDLAPVGNPALASRPVVASAAVVEAVKPAAGPIRGYLEDCRPTRIAGWAQNTVHENRAVHIAILLDGAVLAEVVANQWRGDLQDAKIGDGKHGFEYRPARPLAPEKLRGISIICVADGTALKPVQGLAIP